MIVTLLSDFGAADAYVAAVKGVVLSLAPEAAVVDASHDIPPQDVRAAAWVLGQYWRTYPAGTIHVAVVDPGVGTGRDVLLVEADGRLLLAPDNGLLFWALRQAEKTARRKLKPDVHRPGEVSATFHGRDIFAHAAGLLAGGKAKAEDLSVETSSVVTPPWGELRVSGEQIAGEVVHVDRFGNLITNIGRDDIRRRGWEAFFVRAGLNTGIPVCRTYADVEAGAVLALFGSADTIEISVSGGSAQKQTGLRRGAEVVVGRAVRQTRGAHDRE